MGGRSCILCEYRSENVSIAIILCEYRSENVSIAIILCEYRSENVSIAIIFHMSSKSLKSTSILGFEGGHVKFN